MVFRRFHTHIKDSVYSSFKSAASTLSLGGILRFQEDIIKINGTDSKVRFRGLDDEENIKGIEGFNVVYNNEWNQFLESHFEQQRLRLRGRINQKFICDWNPVSSKLWQYENWIDKPHQGWIDLPLDEPTAPTKWSGLNPEHSFKRINEAGDSVWLKVTYRDNFYVCGHPSGTGGLIDHQALANFEHARIHKPNLYRIYANGERGIMRTGGEFFKQFSEVKHVRPIKKEPGAIHVTLDENVNPYVTVSIWQIGGKEIKQLHEIACKSPDNNAPKAAAKLAGWLRSVDHQDMVFIYGDPSASKRSTIDANNASFYDKFIEVLRREGFHIQSRVARSAPEVALSGAFINDIYENNLNGYSISISDSCKVSIDDYITVKEDPDGRMLKTKIKDPATGITYEPIGHFADAKRYLITTILQPEFNAYKARGKKNYIQLVEQ